MFLQRKHLQIKIRMQGSMKPTTTGNGIYNDCWCNLTVRCVRRACLVEVLPVNKTQLKLSF